MLNSEDGSLLLALEALAGLLSIIEPAGVVDGNLIT